MKAESLPLKDIFLKDVRYVIPMFQRPYVWNQEDQWEPLWDDVRNLAERYLDQYEKLNRDVTQAEKTTPSHFMGAVVVQQVPTAAREVDTREVIDGQQRLTTMQLLLDAAQEVFEEIGAEAEATTLSRLVTNHYGQDDLSFKLWPNPLDQAAFRAAMTNGISTEGFEDSLIVQAHDFFRLQIREWIDSSPNDDTRNLRLHGLEAALYGLLELVVIDLSADDDAFVIFETLNARGTPLLDSDLVKNYILQKATGAGLDSEALYENHWKPLEDPWWRAEVAQGRLVRPRIDVLINYWLISQTAREVLSQDVFSAFKKFVETGPDSVAETAAALHAGADVYRKIDSFPAGSPEALFIYRWRIIDAGSSMPVLLWLFSQDKDVLSELDRQTCLAALESFLVRRMLCRLTTKNYNRLFLELLSQIREAEPGTIATVFQGYLLSQTADSANWPSDTDVRAALLDLPLYKLLTRGRLRFVLEAIEDSMRNTRAEVAHVESNSLTIEHVLPQTWKTYWPLVGEVTIERELERERLVHAIGNLTLVNQSLNSSLSNDAWEDKRSQIEANSVLFLNKDMLSTWGSEPWTETTITARGHALSDLVIGIWPRGTV